MNMSIYYLVPVKNKGEKKVLEVFHRELEFLCVFYFECSRVVFHREKNLRSTNFHILCES